VSDVLRLVKDTVKKTPLWPLLRPRRIHVYGVGAPKTGTKSLARLFGRYRQGHEPHVSQTVDLIRSSPSEHEIRTCLRERDRRWRLECEVGYFLVYLCDALAAEFTEARFICTVRQPRSWLRSIIDQCINNPRSELPSEYRWLRDHSFGPIPDQYPSQEEPLSRFQVHTLEGYLSYWAFHYQTVLDTLSTERCLFVHTKDLTQAPERIANFTGIPVSRLQVDESHVHKTSKKHGVLKTIDDQYLQEKIDMYCHDVANRLSQETEVSFDK